MRLSKQRLYRLERFIGRIQHRNPVVGGVHGMGYQYVESRVVVNYGAFREKRVEGLGTDVHVQSEHTLTVEPRRTVEVAVILRDDGRERELPGVLATSLGIVEEEGITP